MINVYFGSIKKHIQNICKYIYKKHPFRQWKKSEKNVFVLVWLRWIKSYSHFSLFRSKSARSSASSGRRRRSMFGAIPLHFRIVVFGWCATIAGRVLFLISYFVFLSVAKRTNARIVLTNWSKICMVFCCCCYCYWEDFLLYGFCFIENSKKK